jgi:hypothetical protein
LVEGDELLGLRTGSVRSISASTTLNTPVFAPMPNAV